jgi:hypothetical protein
VKIRFFSNIILSERPIVVVRLPKDASFVAPDVLCTETIATVSARISMVASTRSLTDFELRHFASDGFDDTDTFMAECDTVWNVGQISGADSGVRDLNEYVLWERQGYNRPTFEGQVRSCTSHFYPAFAFEFILASAKAWPLERGVSSDTTGVYLLFT